MLFCAARGVVECEWYIDIKAYKLTLFEILGDVHVLSVCIIPDSMTYAVGGIYIYIRSINHIFYSTSTTSASPTPTVIHNNIIIMFL